MAANSFSLPLRHYQNGNHKNLPVAVLLFVLVSLHISPTASQPENFPPPVPNDNIPPGSTMKVSPTMAIVLICMISVFFAMGCTSVYIRQCIERRMTGSFVLDPDGGSRQGRRRTSRGLDAAVIDGFPTFMYSEVKGLKIGQGVLECAVCLNEFEDQETLRMLPKCNHVLHPDCIDGWLCSHSTCPVCRANLVPKPGEPTLPVWIPARDSVPPSPENFNSVVSSDLIIDVQLASRTASSLPATLNQNLSRSASSKTPNQNPSRNASSLPATPNRHPSRKVAPKREGFVGTFMRSFSTGHVLVRPGEDCERFTLRLPEEVKDNLVRTNLQRTNSCVAFPRARSSRRSYRSRSGGTGYERFEGEVRPDKWGFSRTPPFFSRTGSDRTGSTMDGGGTGETSAAGGRSLLVAVNSPLNRLFGVKGSTRKDDVEVGERSFQRLRADS